MTQEELQALCADWQARLRLQDWDVFVVVKRERDMRSNCMGSVNWVLPKRVAAIQILDPCDFPPDVVCEQDQEKTLVHELLHLHFAPFAVAETEDGGPQDLAQEQAINAIASALVKLKREAATPTPDGPLPTEQRGPFTCGPFKVQPFLSGRLEITSPSGATVALEGDEARRLRDILDHQPESVAVTAIQAAFARESNLELAGAAVHAGGTPRPAYGPIPGCEGVKGA